ncbi:MAG: hypothetical protein RLZZ175_1262 [Bacteroidota bacterium]|jgi:predicted MPP superfamily phosphohydrolase
MPNKLIIVPLVLFIFALIDWYVFQGIRSVTNHFKPENQLLLSRIYWSVTVLTFAAFLFYHFGNPYLFGRTFRNFLLVGVFINYFSKIFVVLFLFIDDIIRGFKWIYNQFSTPKTELSQAIPNSETLVPAESNSISRSDFLVKTGLVVGSVPLIAMSYGIISGAHDYRVRRVKLPLANLPKAFDGIKIGQLSDIHSGSFFNKTAVKGGVEMLLNEKPDVVFFTGDLVNNTADELNDYFDIFKHVKAPMGVYSVLGNHDYGDYVQWESKEAKHKNLETLKKAERDMGWNLMMNEHHYLTIGNERIAVLGIENFGAKGRFPKYGKLDLAHKNCEADVKILLSHDPSHWDYQINKEYKDIDLTLAGHTHGMQFGIENQLFKWSPVQYMYEQWGGLYTKQNQHIYVNRGFGFLGFPGRVGMPPEITIIELVRA